MALLLYAEIHRLGGLAGSRNAVLTLFTLYGFIEFKSLTPPITHAQFVSMNFVQRLSSKRVRQIEIRIPYREAGAPL